MKEVAVLDEWPLGGTGMTLDDQTRFQCGEYLKFDPAAEMFVGNSKADEMLTRPYREPFVVPAARSRAASTP